MTHDHSLEQQADRAAAAGQFATARQFLEQAVRADSTNAGLWSKLSAMRKAAGDLRGALDALDKTLAVTPLDYSALLARAFILERMGDPRSGQEFGNALSQAPKDADLPTSMLPAITHARTKWAQYQGRIEDRAGRFEGR